MEPRLEVKRYDVIVAGARCAGASTGMLLARAGLRVLVVDPAERGSDTLSTHALMRGAVRQLDRWGVLDGVREAGTPPIRTTTFHYEDESLRIPIKPSAGVNALYAPRRTLLDSLLCDAAEAAGATVIHGLAVTDLLRDDAGRVRGATIGRGDRPPTDVAADLVIGADGINSRVARLLALEPEHTLPHASATIFGYVPGLDPDGYHWHYAPGASVGVIPTNDGDTCVFASLTPTDLVEGRDAGLDAMHAAVLETVSPELASRVAACGGAPKYRAFAGRPGFVRPGAGPGWALVGDAGYFRDPITAHGITDALREAEFLARAVIEGNDLGLGRYAAERYERIRPLFEVTDRIAALDWSMEAVRLDHLVLAKAMKRLADTQAAFDETPARVA